MQTTNSCILFSFKSVLLFFIFCAVLSCKNTNTQPNDIRSNTVVPTQSQIDYQKMELIGFIHFTTNTFTGKEWGFGDESPTVFNPTFLDAEQWVITAKNAGIKQLILTAKHHDGFCLWPSRFTNHSIQFSPYKNGKGDIVKEFTEACKKHNIKAGLYLSPWDRNHKDYGNPAYVDYYKNQITELLTNYGQINELWFDGANGGDGYYGGTNETRKIEAKTYYRWHEIFELAKELQPNIKLFSDAGPDVHWIGNEAGFAGETFWSTITTDSITIGKSNPAYLNKGDANGKNWVIGQCDVSVRPGWFYHKEEDSLVKTTEQLMDIYLKSVGRNAVLLLNIPPNKDGLFHENDVQALLQLKQTIDTTFKNNYAKNATINASNQRFNHPKFAPENLFDSEKLKHYWATEDTVSSASLTIQLDEEKIVNYVLLQEPIQFGQRISSFSLEAYVNNTWTELYRGTTIGYKRILSLDGVKTNALKLNILKANNTIALSNFEIY